MSAVKTGAVASSRFARAMEKDADKVQISVARSGGGL